MSDRGSLILEDVRKIENFEYPDIFADALSVALCYGDDSIYEKCSLLSAYRLIPGHLDAVYSAISSVTGRAWLVGFDDAAYYWERHGVTMPHSSFSVAGLDAHLEHYDTLIDAIRQMDREPELLWNQDCAYPVDSARAAGLSSASQKTGSAELRDYVTNRLKTDRRPVIVLLHLPGVPDAEIALVTGYEADGAVILGRSPFQNAATDNTGPYGYFRLGSWERDVIAVIGVGAERQAERDKNLCYLMIEKALRFSQSRQQGTRHYGLSAYDAWEAALLDDAAIDGASDEIVSRRLLCHSLTAGFFASQKAFTVFPECQAPSMGVVEGFLRRAAAGPGLIHGLMWDVWHVVGGYWKGVRAGDREYPWVFDNPDELRRFRNRGVRERAAAVVRRARQVDAHAIADLATAKDEWDRCRGHGNEHPCPCWDKPCSRAVPRG